MPNTQVAKIYIVHPDDSNLKFFKKTIKALEAIAGADYLFLGPSQLEHDAALHTLRTAPPATLIFFCHGGEDKNLRGCNRESSQRRAYQHGTFVSPSKNIEILAGKDVFCMACSSRTLGNHAIQAGANVFMGFGEIRFNRDLVKQKRIIDLTKFEIRKLIEKCLFDAIKNKFTFNQLSWNLRYLINRRRSELLLGAGHPDPYVRQQAAILLSMTQRGIVLFGDGSRVFG